MNDRLKIKFHSNKLLYIPEIEYVRDTGNMVKLLIIADDFTGALDTGVQFASCGADTKVITDPHYDFTLAGDNDVLVFDSETRHIKSEDAYRRLGVQVLREFWRMFLGIMGSPQIFLKCLINSFLSAGALIL